MWHGSAAICVTDRQEILMVKQGQAHEPKVWALPSGGLEDGETYADCCVREVWEETGYRVAVQREVFVKEGTTYGVQVEVHYFEVEVLSGEAKIQDPDGLIYEIAWKSAEEVRQLELSFPEDLDMILKYLE